MWFLTFFIVSLFSVYVNTFITIHHAMIIIYQAKSYEKARPVLLRYLYSNYAFRKQLNQFKELSLLWQIKQSPISRLKLKIPVNE